MNDSRAIRCPSCASPVPVDARFCPTCGHAIAAGATDARRVVTVLFADLVGFTGLAEQLDPEHVKRLVERTFERLVDDVTAFGGRVDKLLGDGILALFGAPVAHEDDAERAVRAALRMQQTLAGLAGDESLPLRMRIGINTGEVLVGTLAGTDYTAMGDVVNTASRIQSAAPPGGVLVGAATHALTAGVIGYEEPVELQARGREQPVTAWLATEALAPPGSRSRRHDLSLVGRTAELALVDAAVQLALGEGRSLLLNVVGESGVGKSRLVEEVLADLGEDVLVLEGVCAPYGERNVWFPIATALLAELGIEGLPDADELRRRATAKATRLFEAPADSPDVAKLVEVFVHLLGEPSTLDELDPGARRDLVHHAVARVVERRCQRSPVVVWVDDLHWADDVVVDLLEHLGSSFSRLPFVLVTSMRPGSDVVWPPIGDRITVVSLQVHPLDREESDELAIELLREADAGADPRLLGALFDRSGGNPLFLQELAGMVAQDGQAIELPETLRALIAARLDQLAPEERQVLDNAAVLGGSGNVAALERFAAAMHQRFDQSLVARLDAKGLLLVEGRRWRFRSDSVREAAYQMLTKTSRAVRHAGVFASIAGHSPTALDDLAHHAAAAAELVAELGPVDGVPATIRHEALRYLTLAAERARETGSQRLVVHHASRAIGLIERAGTPDDAGQLLRLRLLRSAGFIEMHDYEPARAELEAVLAEATELDDAELEGEARWLLGSLWHLQGDQAAARADLGRSVELLRESGATALLAGALRQRGFIELFGGSLTDAEWFFGEAEAAYRSLDDERGLAYVEQHRAWLSFLSGDLELADERLHHAADTLNRLGDRNGVGWAFGLLAFVRFFQRRFEEAEDLATIVRAEATERGDDWAAAMMQTLLADLRLWQGQLDEALTNAEQARNRFRRLGDKLGLVQSISALVRAQVALGRTAAMHRSAEELLSLAESSPMGPVPLLGVAGAAMHRGDGATALHIAERAIAEMQEMRAGSFEAQVVRAVALAQTGDVDGALVAVDELGALGAEHPFAHMAMALVHALAGDHDAALREAAAVVDAAGSTYLDRAIASVAAAGAHAARGDDESADRVLHDSLAECLRIGDVVATALVQRAHLHVLGREHPSGPGDAGALCEGWLSVVARLPTVERVA